MALARAAIPPMNVPQMPRMWIRMPVRELGAGHQYIDDDVGRAYHQAVDQVQVQALERLELQGVAQDVGHDGHGPGHQHDVRDEDHHLGRIGGEQDAGRIHGYGQEVQQDAGPEPSDERLVEPVQPGTSCQYHDEETELQVALETRLDEGAQPGDVLDQERKP